VHVTRRLGLAVAAFVAAAGLVAACSSSGSSPGTPKNATAAYAEVVQRVATDELAAQQRAAQAFKTKSLTKLRNGLKTFELAQIGLATKLAALMPPADATAANAALVQAFTDSASAIQSLVDRTAQSRSVRKAFDVIQSDRAVKQAGNAIGAAMLQLQTLGYLTETPSS
jgi:hypothetical protein